MICDQVWLSHLSEEMKNTLCELLKSCLRDARSGKGGLDPNKYPSQVDSVLFNYCVACWCYVWHVDLKILWVSLLAVSVHVCSAQVVHGCMPA